MKHKIKIKKQLALAFGIFSLVFTLLIALLLNFAVGKSFDNYLIVKNQQILESQLSQEDTSSVVFGALRSNRSVLQRNNANTSGMHYQLNSVEQNLKNSINYYILIIGIFSFLVSIVVGYLLSKRISRPLMTLKEATTKIENGDYDIKLKKNTSIEEISLLIVALEKMANRINENIEHDKRLSQDVQHELRTPITNLKLQIEAMLDDVWDLDKDNLNLCLNEIERLNKIVDQLHQLGMIENDDTITVVDFNLKNLIDTLAKEHHLMLEKNKMILINNITPDVEINNDENIIKSAINNLISNAIRYSGENTKVTIDYNQFNANDVSSKYYKIISENLDVNNSYDIISVSDNGKGIAQENLDKIFERFYRVDKSRSRNLGGSGLGLSIVYASAKKLDGFIYVTSKENEETKFSYIIKK
ncbi:MAG: sensor histidine kinase [Pleomorphochaeta sp.]